MSKRSDARLSWVSERGLHAGYGDKGVVDDGAGVEDPVAELGQHAVAASIGTARA